MRAAIASDLVEVDPGGVAAVTVDVANTSDVIDGVAARVIGLDEQYVTASPKLLPLFPDARGTLQLSLAMPTWFPAGPRQVAVEVQSHGALEPSLYLDLSLLVAARPAMSLGCSPKVVRARRTGKFVVQVHNQGNVALDVNLRATDIDRSCTCRIVPESVRVEAGTTANVLLTIRGPRLITGGELDRNITIEATPSRLDLDPDAPVPDDDVSGSRTLSVTLRQRPLVSRGVMTALILTGIVALWAGAFLLGIAKVFTSDPLTKDAPASFFVSASGSGGTGGAAKLAGDPSGSGGDGAPAGSLPKSGQVSADIGGQISGTVRATSDHLPVGRILVQAVRLRNGAPTVVSSAATQADGTYTLAGLFPMDYYVSFSAPGFRTVWYPAAPTLQGGRQVGASAQATTSGIDAVITGLPAQISGQVKAIGATGAVPTTVVANPLAGDGAPVTTHTDGAGNYTLRNLPAPGTYELTFTAAGYQADAITDSVTGGEARSEPNVLLGAGTGQITGMVRDSHGNGVGGATITTTVNGSPLTVVTPTTGQVGAYTLANLLTPATYVITYSAPGHGSVSAVVNLDPGKGATHDVTLTAGTGSVTGTVTATPDGKTLPLGGVTITVGGAVTASGNSPTTTTLTNGTGVGSFQLNNLAAPGSYTITASLAGYNPVTVPFQLQLNGTGAQVNIVLSVSTGSVRGTVSGACAQAGCAGDTVTITDGATVQTVRVTSTGYEVTGLHPGSYSVTVVDPDLGQQTAMVFVVAGSPATQNFSLGH